MILAGSLIKSPEQLILNAVDGGARRAAISTLHGSSKTLAIMALSRQWNQVVVLFDSLRGVQETEVELSLLGCAVPVIAITDYGLEPIQERATLISRTERFIALGTYRLLKTFLPIKQSLMENLIQISPGDAPGYDELVEYLNLFNYQREDYVDAPGSFSKRGAIIDFWSYSESEPARLEFDGDMLDSMRTFDPESQRSIESIAVTTLAPPMLDVENEQALAPILDYFADALILYNSNDAEQYAEEIEERGLHMDEKAAIGKHKDEWYDIPPDKSDEPAPRLTRESGPDMVKQCINDFPRFCWLSETVFAEEPDVRLGIREAPAVNANYQLLFREIARLAERGLAVIIAVENQLQFDRYQALLDEPQNGVNDLVDSGRVRVIVLPIKAGFVNEADKLAVFTDYQLFNKPYRSKLARRLKRPVKKTKMTEAIRTGDFVVHEDYGIGKYLGLEAITIGEAEQESMKLVYAEGGIVYVNLNYLHLVKKYSAKEGIHPTLSTLGTADWSNKKRKTKGKIREAAKELIELYAKRKLTKGYAYHADTIWQAELEASFMYEDTVDQARVTDEVKNDMLASSPMDRLVCGDVGFGKTEIAVRAAFRAAQDGKQTGILVPTTILAEQHYHTFKDRLQQFPVSIAMLSRFQSKSEQKEIIEQMEKGKVDIVVGTHRLLSADVKFKDLGLLIIDEEHRFGVTAKEKLRRFHLNVDILTLTATPIPRTLNLSLLGARDLSILATPPANRQPIYTKVESSRHANVRAWILREMNRGGQVYIVHDRVQTIERFAEYILKQAPEATIGIAHGQMPPSKLENVFHNFLHRKTDILIATKIIESGLDIPNVNTIIINRADRFGLAELHQLRGRVGRSEKQAYAYLLVPEIKGLQKATIHRLRAIEDHSELGAGFQLAMRDLEIRGAGNLLGAEQTGFVNEIGFDLYVKLINETVEELKQQEFRELFKDMPASRRKVETVIEAYFELGIPNAYIPDQMDRLSYYTSLASISGLTDLREIEEEMKDRFGVLPMLVKRLFRSAELKFFASYAMFQRMVIQQGRIIIVLPPADDEEYYQAKFPLLAELLMGKYKGKIKLVQKSQSLQLQIEQSFNVPEAAIEFLTAFAKEAAALYGVVSDDAPVVLEA